MNKTQEAKIKKLTKFTYTQIREMNDVEFYRNITKLMVANTITPLQYKWLEGERLGETTQRVLKLIGGEYIEKTKEINNCLK